MSGSLWGFLGMLATAIPLLVVASLAVSVLQLFLTRERVSSLMESGGVRAYAVAVAVGIVTPFNAATALPAAAGLLHSGATLGVVATFMVISPFVSAVPLATLATGMGWRAGAVYFAGVVTLGVLTGLLCDRMGWTVRLPQPAAPVAERHGEGLTSGLLRQTWLMVRQVLPYLSFGMALALIAYLFLPGETLAKYVSDGHWWAFPLAALMGVPVINLVPVLLPISVVLVDKGVALGAVLTFSMAAAGLKLPEALFMRQMLGSKVVFYLLTTILAGALGAGYIASLVG